MIVVIQIGCLECGNASDLLGIYPDRATAKAAHPDLQLREEMPDDDHWPVEEYMTLGFEHPDPA